LYTGRPFAAVDHDMGDDAIRDVFEILDVLTHLRSAAVDPTARAAAILQAGFLCAAAS